MQMQLKTFINLLNWIQKNQKLGITWVTPIQLKGIFSFFNILTFYIRDRKKAHEMFDKALEFDSKNAKIYHSKGLAH